MITNALESTQANTSKGRGLTTVPNDLPLMLTVKDAASIGGFCQKFVRDMCVKGEIKSVKIGGAWRVNRDEYLAQLGLA